MKITAVDGNGVIVEGITTEGSYSVDKVKLVLEDRDNNLSGKIHLPVLEAKMLAVTIFELLRDSEIERE